MARSGLEPRRALVLLLGDLEVYHDGREAALVYVLVNSTVAVDVPKPSLDLIAASLLDDETLLEFLQGLNWPKLLEP